MKIHSVHERMLNGTAPDVGALLDGLMTPEDKLWPHDRWPGPRLDGPLAVGSVGSIGDEARRRFRVAEYEPGRRVRVAFNDERGIVGYHEYEVITIGPVTTKLQHIFDAEVSGLAIVRWPLEFGPMLDALIEDSFDNAAAHLAGVPVTRRTLSRPLRAVRAITPNVD